MTRTVEVGRGRELNSLQLGQGHCVYEKMLIELKLRLWQSKGIDLPRHIFFSAGRWKVPRPAFPAPSTISQVVVKDTVEAVWQGSVAWNSILSKFEYRRK